MDATSVLNIVLPIVFIIVGIVLIWLLVELAKTVKTTRQAVDDLQTKVVPTLEHVDKITNDLQPAVTKVDPMMERLALTVDAVNLELMRVDQILEDVNDVTGSLSKTTNAIDNVTSAPLNLVNSMTERVRGALKSSKPSDESIALAEAAAQGNDLDQTAELPLIADDEPVASEDTAGSSGYFTYGKDTEVKEGPLHAAVEEAAAPSVVLPEIEADQPVNTAALDDAASAFGAEATEGAHAAFDTDTVLEGDPFVEEED